MEGVKPGLSSANNSLQCRPNTWRSPVKVYTVCSVKTDPIYGVATDSNSRRLKSTRPLCASQAQASLITFQSSKGFQGVNIQIYLSGLGLICTYPSSSLHACKNCLM